MKLLCLNCRGLGRPEAVREVHSLCELHCPWVVFLSETRFFSDRVDGLVSTLGMEGGFGVGTRGQGGGLALLWSREVTVKLESYDRLHVDVTIRAVSSQFEEWRFTGFYGESRRELRYRSWDLLNLLSSKSELPWICVGDFNECLHAREQFGGQGRSERQMEGFQEAVEVCGFADLGYIGLPYTWDNRQQHGSNVKVRLDRRLVTAEFLNLFSVCQGLAYSNDRVGPLLFGVGMLTEGQ